MASMLDKLFGTKGSRAERINKAVEDALEGKKKKKPTLGNPEGEETSRINKIKDRQVAMAGSIRRNA